jgi:dCTP deaminase
MAAQGMITPFEDKLVRRTDAGLAVISYGLSSYGYDIRLSPADFRIFRHVPGTVIDPKRFNPHNLEPAELHQDELGSFFILPGHSYGLGVALEKLAVPDNATVLCIGKSTYARAGIIANLTPAEACLSADTEVLTRTGWRNISHVLIGEEVMCLKGKKAVYEKVEDFHSYYFNGDLLHFKSRFVSQLVTPQHKIWAAISKRRVLAGAGYSEGRTRGIQRLAKMEYPFERIQADEVFGKHNLYLSREVDWDGVAEHEDGITVGTKTYPREAFLRFVGCWLGDGSAFVSPGGNYVIKLAVVTKPKKRAYFQDVLEELGVNYWLGERGFEFRCKDLCLYLKRWSGAHNKRVPREFMSLPASDLRCIREGLMASDGNVESSTYVSVSQGLVGDFQEISLKIGDNATVWEGGSAIRDSNFHWWKCRFSGRGKTPSKILPENCKKVPYSDMVYDLTVPSHVFLVRHNGRCSWTGNSWRGHLTLEFSNSSPADARIYAGEGCVQLLFFEGAPCEVSYETRKGKYQDQGEEVTIARV